MLHNIFAHQVLGHMGQLTIIVLFMHVKLKKSSIYTFGRTVHSFTIIVIAHIHIHYIYQIILMAYPCLVKVSCKTVNIIIL